MFLGRERDGRAGAVRGGGETPIATVDTSDKDFDSGEQSSEDAED